MAPYFYQTHLPFLPQGSPLPFLALCVGTTALSAFGSPALYPFPQPSSQSGKQLCKLTSGGIHWLSSGILSPTGCQHRLFTLHNGREKSACSVATVKQRTC